MMALPMTPIFTQTASGSASSIVFNNIPQVYTDLKLVVSARVVSGGFYQNLTLTFNGNFSNYSVTRMFGDGQGNYFSDRFSNQSFIYIGEVSGDTSTSNTFGVVEVYIPNYTSSNFKQIINDSAAENNAVAQYMGLKAALWSNTSAITSLKIDTTGGNYVANSTFSLYGIIRPGA